MTELFEADTVSARHGRVINTSTQIQDHLHVKVLWTNAYPLTTISIMDLALSSNIIFAPSTAFLLHIIVETPAAINFLISPSSTLQQPQPFSHAVIRQYGSLLLVTNLILAIVRSHCPEDVQRCVSGALALYHIGPLWRSVVRIRDREESSSVLAGPWLHFGLHGLLFVVLSGSGNWGAWSLRLLAEVF